MAPNPIRVAVVQTAPELGEVDANLDYAHERLAELAPHADIVVFPELHLGGYYFPDGNDIALSRDDPRLAALGRHGPAVLMGFVERLASLNYNAAAVIDNGRVVVERKAFLPSAQERRWFQPGEMYKQVLRLRGAAIAVPICYDMWMAPVPWQAAASGAEILIVPSASAADTLAAPDGVPVDEHWRILNEHGAVAMQSFVVFVNRVGTERDPDTGIAKTFWGGSVVLGPDGQARSSPLDDNPGVSVAELDLRQVHTGRRKLPTLPDYRRFALEPLTTNGQFSIPRVSGTSGGTGAGHIPEPEPA